MKKFSVKKTIIILSAVLILIVATVITVSGDTFRYNPNDATRANLNTVSAMQDYKAEVEAENTKLPSNLENVISTITFSKAMSFDEFKQYVESYNIEILRIQARGFDKNGDRTTLYSRADNGLDKTFDLIELALQSSPSDYAGIISVYALVNSNDVEAIQNDNNTFLIDTSMDNYYRKNVFNIFRKGDDPDLFFPHSVAWDAEDLGLADYRTAE